MKIEEKECSTPARRMRTRAPSSQGAELGDSQEPAAPGLTATDRSSKHFALSSLLSARTEQKPVKKALVYPTNKATFLLNLAVSATLPVLRYSVSIPRP